jgi:hypothetical protein
VFGCSFDLFCAQLVYGGLPAESSDEEGVLRSCKVRAGYEQFGPDELGTLPLNARRIGTVLEGKTELITFLEVGMTGRMAGSTSHGNLLGD